MAQKTQRVELPLHQAITIAIENSVSLAEKGIQGSVYYLVGPPGGGKTQMIAEYAQNSGYAFIPCTPALERVEKFGGIPDIGDNESGDLITRWSVPHLIEEVRDKAKKAEYVLVLFDDWHLCPSNIQQIGFELFTHRSLNGHKVPDNAIFILAGNEKSAAGAKVALSAIRNRSLMLYSESDVNYWIDNYATPRNLHPIGISFFCMNENKSLFHMEESTNEQFGSPRSWTNLFQNLRALEDSGFNFNAPGAKSVLMGIFQGCVGNTAASKFNEYYTVYSKIPVDHIFETGIFSIPDEPVQRYAFAYAVSAGFYDRYITATKDGKKKELERYCNTFGKILSQLYQNYKEIAVRAMRFIVEKPQNSEFDVGSGVEILAKMVTQKQIPQDFMVKLRQTATILGKQKAKS